MLEHDSGVLRAQGSGRKDVLLVLEAVELHTGSTRHADPSRCKEGYEQDEGLAGRAHVVFQKGNDDDGGHGAEDLGEALHDEIHLAAEVARDGAPDHTDDEVGGSHNGSEDKGEACAVGEAGEDILTRLGGTEQEQGLLDAVLPDLVVLVDIVLVILGSHLDTAVDLTTVGVEVLLAVLGDTVLALNTKGVILGHEVVLLAGLILPVVGDDVPLGVQLGAQGGGAGVFHLIVDIGVVLILLQRRSVRELDHGVQDLTSGSVLVLLDGLKLLAGDGLILTEAHAVVGIVAVAVGRAVGADGIFAVLDDVAPRLGGESEVLQVADVARVLFLTAIPEVEAAIGEQVGLGGDVGVHHIVVRGLEGGEEGGQDGEQDQERDDDTAHDGALVLAEAAERALEVGDGLGLELTVVIQVVSLGKLEFFSGDIVQIHILIHNYLAPILILGSMKP